MSTTFNTRPDAAEAMRELKSFQRRTVEYAFRRLYTDADSTHRFLVADEVGLGKTMVARGVIARAVEHLWDRVAQVDGERIDIVYVCSNAEIARQNIRKLLPKGSADFAMATRATLLPIEVHELAKRKLNYVSMTPGTSLDPRGGTGIARERALLYHLLRDHWELPYVPATNVLRAGKGPGRFREMVDYFLEHPGWGYQIDPQLKAAFLAALDAQEGADRSPSLRARFLALCVKYPRSDASVDDATWIERSRCIAELRSVLGRVCIRALRPDLVILDEFQRFKHLLADDNEDAELARELFEYADEDGGGAVRVLLLSATPYKMFTLQHETEESGEDHYADFLATYGFLVRHAPEEVAALRGCLAEYRTRLMGLSPATLGDLRGLRERIQTRLAAVMSRTERLASTLDRDGMLAPKAMDGLCLQDRDVKQFVAASRISRALAQGDLVEYWKSAPFLLNFMDGYELKKGFTAATVGPPSPQLLAAVTAGSDALLAWDDVRAYKPIDPANARLRGLLHDTVERGWWRLLWLPPSMPYYAPGGAYANFDALQVTKRLVFSSWKVVPKIVAAMVSYDAERQALAGYEGALGIGPSDGERKRLAPLLQLGRSTDGRLRGMPVLGLMYPSTALASMVDPAELAAAPEQPLQTADDLLTRAQLRIEPELARVIGKYATGTASDEAWYWAAPILLDAERDRTGTATFLERPRLATEWLGERESESGDSQEPDEKQGWVDHVDAARELIRGGMTLGRPPDDLSKVLALLAIGGPAVTALRSLTRGRPGPDRFDDASVRLASASIGWRFRVLFNRPDAIAVVRGLDRSEPYWRRVLEYCVHGGVQAVLDEYVHLLRENLGLATAAWGEAALEIAKALALAMSIPAGRVNVDDVRLSPARDRVVTHREVIPSRFAGRYGQDASEESLRADEVRAAFNSPFWPFVLASTSVGQEGLDFHHYCHAIVHWNLPTNPVDLEQREGRVHRYMGHAIRKNIGMAHGRRRPAPATEDPWTQVVSMAIAEEAGGGNEMKPFWVYRPAGGVSIERYVAALPLSEDAHRLESLRKSLAVYRMVFGQPRQDELIAYLLAHHPKELVERAAAELRINLEPPMVV